MGEEVCLEMNWEMMLVLVRSRIESREGRERGFVSGG